jgi:hypothetical protein
LSETDSFIEEVTEEVRRDKLYGLVRKYGWIAVLLVVLIVGGAAFNEWRKARDRAAAEAFGDSILSALEQEDPSARASALAGVASGNPDAGVLLAMLRAAAEVEADRRDAAVEILDAIAANPQAPQTYRELATLKAVILRGADMDRDERIAALDLLATPGRPFRLIALEQKALALSEFGDNDAAIALLRTILDEPGISQGLLQRTQQLIVSLGGTLESPDAASEDNG